MGKIILRKEFIQLLSAAIINGAYRFAREASELWLRSYPGDLEINLYLAKSLCGLKRLSEAIDIARKITQIDPEYLDAHQFLLAQVEPSTASEYQNNAAYIHALSGQTFDGEVLPDWCIDLYRIKKSLLSKNIKEANSIVTRVQRIDPPVDLVGITQIQIAEAENDSRSILQIAEINHSRFPNCLQFKLWLANYQLETNTSEDMSAVNLLHQCVSKDAVGQVITRLWGEKHRYKQLWPENLHINFDIAIPADVLAVFGLNQLPDGLSQKREQVEDKKNWEFIDRNVERHEDKSVKYEAIKNGLHQNRSKLIQKKENISTESNYKNSSHVINDEFILEEIQPSKNVLTNKKKSNFEAVEKVFENLAKKINQPEIAKSDSRYPVYVIFSSKLGLEKTYGPEQIGNIHTELKQLETIIKTKVNGWDALLYYPDDEECTSKLGLPPIVSSDPWKFKLSLTDLDRILAKKGKMIGAVLIVGGPEIVPFHRLPNPTEDMDDDVLSDNPYATHDSNYFIPEWQVGRVPGEKGSNSSLLIKQIQQISVRHESLIINESVWSRLSYPFDQILHWFWNVSRFSSLRIKLSKTKTIGFGYTAAIWRRSSIAVYRPLSDAGTLMVSPPIEAASLDINKITNSKNGYFNLHGIENSGEWFGQRDVYDSAGGPDYPVALKPEDIKINGKFPEIVYSEACYGAHIINKRANNALSLKFLEIGTKAFIGSTCIAYGSVTTPLIGADLLGYIFWKFISDGFTVGEAYKRAKIEFVREMTKRQGYLDGEDQKTLLSFILLGDPLETGQVTKNSTKRIARSTRREKVKTICDNDMNVNGSRSLPREVLEEVKKSLERYLPGIEDANVSFIQQFAGYQEFDNNGIVDKKTKKNIKLEKTGNVVVSVKKSVDTANRQHHHFARVTIDQQGNMVKLALSR